MFIRLRVKQFPGVGYVGQPAHTPPNGLHSGVPIMCTPQETAQLGEPTHGLVQARRSRWRCRSLVHCTVKALPFVGFQYSVAGHLRSLPCLVSQPQQAPSHDAVGHQRSVNPLRILQLQFFQVTAAFEDKVVALHQPTVAVPFQALDGLLERVDRQRGEQQPAQRCCPWWWLLFFGQDHLYRNRAETASLAAERSGRSSSIVELMNTRSFWSGVRIPRLANVVGVTKKSPVPLATDDRPVT